MQSDPNSFRDDIVLDSVNMTFRDENNIFVLENIIDF